MTIAFTGHSKIFSGNLVKEMVKEQIKNNIIGMNSVTCYIGGYGDFDEICALACKELKLECDGIEVVYVTPYINQQERLKIKEMQNNGLCDTSVYPPIENTPLRFAILKRNEWMMTNADLIIAYVNHNYGGAYKSLQTAKRRKKKVINIFDIL